MPERTEIRFKLDARAARAGLIRDLAHLVKDYPGESPVYVSLETSLGPKTLALGADYRVEIDPDFLTEARSSSARTRSCERSDRQRRSGFCRATGSSEHGDTVIS